MVMRILKMLIINNSKRILYFNRVYQETRFEPKQPKLTIGGTSPKSAQSTKKYQMYSVLFKHTKRGNIFFFQNGAILLIFDPR